MKCKKLRRPYSFSANLLTWALVFILGASISLSAHGQSSVKTVVIDAGHGGKDPGNMGTGRYKKTEKDIALEVALKLGNYIKEEFPEIKVIFTRKDDSFVTLKDRTVIANKNKADLFISIHCNSAKNTEASGTETFVMGFKYEKENLALTKMENSVIFMEDDYQETYSDFDPNNPESDMFAALYQSAFQDQSISFANYVEQQFANRVGRRSRGVKQGVLYVLNRSTMPSVLVELGFLTNRSEEDFLLSELGQVYMASAIYRAFKEFKEQRESVDATVIKSKPVPRAADVDNKPKETGDNPYDIVFRIQLLSSARKVESTESAFNGLDKVDELQIDNRFKYVYGSYPTYDEAKKSLKDVRKEGFESAFVIALKNNEPVDVRDAIKELKKQ
ncbi:MAG: N-acetylmuramoyl-L-alanine amidase family protein [Luteibaculum sp.]